MPILMIPQVLLTDALLGGFLSRMVIVDCVSGTWNCCRMPPLNQILVGSHHRKITYSHCCSSVDTITFLVWLPSDFLAPVISSCLSQKELLATGTFTQPHNTCPVVRKTSTVQSCTTAPASPCFLCPSGNHPPPGHTDSS